MRVVSKIQGSGRFAATGYLLGPYGLDRITAIAHGALPKRAVFSSSSRPRVDLQTFDVDAQRRVRYRAGHNVPWEFQQMDFSAASSKIVRPNFFLSRGFLSAPAFFLFLAVALAFAPGARASITYDMTNYPSSQPDSQGGNYTVSGTITTDGATVLSNSDIQSYLISITDPTTQYSFVLSNTNSTLTAVGLQANATSLYLLQGGNNFLEINDSSNSAELLYRDSLPEEGGPPQYSYKTSLGTLWSRGPGVRRVQSRSCDRHRSDDHCGPSRSRFNGSRTHDPNRLVAAGIGRGSLSEAAARRRSEGNRNQFSCRTIAPVRGNQVSYQLVPRTGEAPREWWANTGHIFPNRSTPSRSSVTTFQRSWRPKWGVTSGTSRRTRSKGPGRYPRGPAYRRVF